MDIRSLREFGREILSEKGIADADIDTDLILCEVLKADRADLFLKGDDELSEFDERLFRRLLDKRSARIPLAYVLGHSCFYGREFIVNNAVLTPRQETELLVEKAMEYVTDGTRAIDICTGSGCIPVSMAKNSEEARIKDTYFAGTDISEDALKVAAENAKNLGAKVDFFIGDMTLAIPNVDEFDIITANPPYIRKRDIESLEPEVSEYEPRLALDGGEDGLNFYRRLAGSAHEFLKDSGVLIMEIGYDQAMDVRNIFSVPHYRDFEVIKDYSGNDRLVVLKR